MVSTTVYCVWDSEKNLFLASSNCSIAHAHTLHGHTKSACSTILTTFQFVLTNQSVIIGWSSRWWSEKWRKSVTFLTVAYINSVAGTSHVLCHQQCIHAMGRWSMRLTYWISQFSKTNYPQLEDGAQMRQQQKKQNTEPHNVQASDWTRREHQRSTMMQLKCSEDQFGSFTTDKATTTYGWSFLVFDSNKCTQQSQHACQMHIHF